MKRRIERYRYRLAARLLGYRPMPEPAENGAWIVYIEKNVRVQIRAKSLRIESTIDHKVFGADQYRTYDIARRARTFSGELG